MIGYNNYKVCRIVFSRNINIYHIRLLLMLGIISFKDKESFDNSIVDYITSCQEIVQNLIDKTSNDFALNATEYIKS